MRNLAPAGAVFAVALSACIQSAPTPAASETAEAPAASAEPSPPPAQPAAAASGEDLSAPQLVPEAEKGEKGARNVLIEWARALEHRDFARADAQWGAGAADAHSAARFASYDTITIGFGDGDVEGAAGSLYYEVPLTFTGKRKDGTDVNKQGTVTLRRVNDVDGATVAQLRWHVAGLALEL